MPTLSTVSQFTEKQPAFTAGSMRALIFNVTNREKRAINALSNGAVMRENLDFIVGCSNSPELVAGLRRKGLSVPCERVERFDKDGNSCYPGRYSFTPDDKAIVRAWFEPKAAATAKVSEGKA